MINETSIFKTPEYERQYFELYDAILAMWSVPTQSMDIPTDFGLTHINTCGDQSLFPMILLPGFGANSTMWFPNAAALSARYHVFAIDTPGQPGRSIPKQTITPANCSDWLGQVLDGLGIQKTHMAGISLGGWLTLNFGIHHPERLSHIALIDPAASFAGMSSAFLRRSFIPFMVHPTRPGLQKYFRWMTQGYMVNPKWGELMILGVLNTRPQPPIRAKAYTDDELKQVLVPTLLIVGGKSVIYDPERIVERASRLIPNIKAEIIPDASHAVNAEKADEVNKLILDFFQMQKE